MQSTPLLCLLQTCLHQREPQKAGSIPGRGMEFVVSFLNCFFWGEGGQDKSLLSIGIKCLRPTKCCAQPGDRTPTPDALTPACPAPLPSAAPPPRAAPIPLSRGILPTAWVCFTEGFVLAVPAHFPSVSRGCRDLLLPHFCQHPTEALVGGSLSRCHPRCALPLSLHRHPHSPVTQLSGHGHDNAQLHCRFPMIYLF